MSPELVERVARMLARAHFGVSGYWAKENAIALSFMADARYALALAERAAREGMALAAGKFDDAPPDYWRADDFRLDNVEAAVRRAVEGA